MAQALINGQLKEHFFNNDLNELDLSWKEAELPQSARTKHVHKLHPYMGKFIPQLVEIFLKRFFKPGDKILDPFGGSGTALVESLSYGASAVGVDISAFNCIMMDVKTAKYNISKLEKEILDIYNKTKSYFTEDGELKLFDKNYDIKITEDDLITENKFINKWYTNRARNELLVYRYLIPNYSYQKVLKVILSRSARSARNIKHYELDNPKEPVKGPYYCKKHGRTCYPVAEAMKFLKSYSFDTIDRIKEFDQVRKSDDVKIINNDVSDFVLENKADGVITSPPYVGNIDYHKQHRYAYELLSLDRNDNKEIGPKFKGRSKSARKEYKDKMIDAMKNISKNVKKGGKIIVVANDKYDMYNDIFEAANIKMIEIIDRNVDRRTGRRATGYSESIFVTENK